MNLDNPTINDYFRAARQLCVGSTPLPPPLAAIVAEFFGPRDGVGFRDLLCECLPGIDAEREWIVNIPNATRVNIERRESGGLVSIAVSTKTDRYRCSFDGRKHQFERVAHYMDVDRGPSRAFIMHKMCLPGMRGAYANAGLLKLIDDSVDFDDVPQNPWSRIRSLVRQNAHCVCAGVRKFVGRSGAHVADLFLVTRSGELIACCIYAGVRWPLHGNEVPRIQWRACQGRNRCTICEHHYDGRWRRSFGMKWKNVFADNLRESENEILAHIAHDINTSHHSTVRVGIAKVHHSRYLVYFEPSGQCRLYDPPMSRLVRLPRSPYRWPPHRRGPYCQCERHYRGPHRQTFGVQWIDSRSKN
jgi:hypothetical protein